MSIFIVLTFSMLSLSAEFYAEKGSGVTTYYPLNVCTYVASSYQKYEKVDTTLTITTYSDETCTTQTEQKTQTIEASALVTERPTTFGYIHIPSNKCTDKTQIEETSTVSIFMSGCSSESTKVVFYQKDSIFVYVQYIFEKTDDNLCTNFTKGVQLSTVGCSGDFYYLDAMNCDEYYEFNGNKCDCLFIDNIKPDDDGKCNKPKEDLNATQLTISLIVLGVSCLIFIGLFIFAVVRKVMTRKPAPPKDEEEAK
ncbi:hypothetical protein EIN_130370 [Entamoeba invadens IP1]|uniref:Transmembrane protein n=1 Tax=Entamoeba invadens IP1 TaxID=370355 RepID=A0A0A1UGY6_ENTIV|nr:hypothetical protein EIN_130370 [Entamoeba invadens IP1]ELP94308.1 hypothetical protein EIN_130370 [Entamoeba invadens IP1]|eukprot:XP_004261079.1 hypothetical protein EIN_130370 [Entamoeba invadens IP1]